MDKYKKIRKTNEPRKILKVTSSKYERSKAMQDSKMYWNNTLNNLPGTSAEQMQEKEIHLLSEILPEHLYKKICSILDIHTSFKELKKIDQVQEQSPRKLIYSKRLNLPQEQSPRRLVKQLQLSRKQIVNIKRDLDSDTDVEFVSSDEETAPNVHQEFLNKPERQQITWSTRYLEPEKDNEKSLVKKADDLTHKIAHDFCDYMKQLGGDQQSQLFTPKAIKELFQIEFDTHVARSLQVVPKEMPTVEERIANITENPKKSRYAALARQISRDIKAECQKDNLCAFNRSLPNKQQWRAPRNNTKNLWQSARHVPQDLVTLKTVWEGITNLRSVKEYCRWMIEHPEYRRAPYLRSLGMFDSAMLDARLTFEVQQQLSPMVSPTDIPAPIDHIRKRLSILADTVSTD